MKFIYFAKFPILISLTALGQVTNAAPIYLECIMNGIISSSGKKFDGPLPEEIAILRIDDTKYEMKFSAKSKNYLMSLEFKKDRLMIDNENIKSKILDNSSADAYKFTKFMEVENIKQTVILDLNRVTGQLSYQEHEHLDKEQFLSHIYSGACSVAKRQIRKF